MNKTKLKILITAFFAVLMIAVCAIPCFAQFDMTGHYDPTGTTSTYYAYSSSECNRTINVSMYDLNGNFLKKVVLKTKHGEDNSFHIGIGGYDRRDLQPCHLQSTIRYIPRRSCRQQPRRRAVRQSSLL